MHILLFDFVTFTQPAILQKAGYLVDFPRRDYSNNFALLVAGDDVEKDDYKSGLMILGCILASIWAVWAMVLLVLKCKGKSVGCASGHSFKGERIANNNNNINRNANSAGSTDMEEEEWTSREDSQSQSREQYDGDEVSFHSSIHSSEIDDAEVRSNESIQSTIPSVQEEFISKATAREQRTQIAFFLFGIFTLALVPLVLTVFFSPLREAADSTEEYISQSRSILSEVENSLKSIDVTVDAATQIFTGLPTIVDICPEMTLEQVQQEFNIDLSFVVSTLTREYDQISESLQARLSDIISNVNEFEQVVSTMEEAHDKTDTYLWAVPGVMLALTSVTAALLVGVLLAWKRYSDDDAQRTLSYFVLPCLIILSLLCWVVGISSAVSVAVLNDGCTGGSNGIPADSVDKIVALQGYSPNSTTFRIVREFTRGCEGDINPTAFIESLEDEINIIVDEIWAYAATVQSVGELNLASACGSDNVLNVLDDGQNIARLLTSIRRALTAISASVKCHEIYPLYVEAVEDTTCTNLATAFSWSMFLFLLLGISTMCMITLRASWRHKVGEDQIYNEDEVDENMFLDEHEEYLHYISKFKHEWEEYGGISNPAQMVPPQECSYSNPTNSEGTTSSRAFSQRQSEIYMDNEDDTSVEQVDYIIRQSTSHQEPFNPYSGAYPSSPSYDTSTDISFPSLKSLHVKTQDDASGK
jgi:hypothetical protein